MFAQAAAQGMGRGRGGGGPRMTQMGPGVFTMNFGGPGGFMGA